MKRAFEAAGLPVTPFRLLLDIADLPNVADGMKWPVVVKPVLGTGSIDIAVLRSLDHFEGFYQSAASAGHRARTKPLILEEEIDYLWEFHCDGIVHDGSVTFAQPGRYLGSLLGSIGSPNGSWVIPADSADGTAICELHRCAVQVTGLRDGITHMEGYRTKQGYLIGEISCRPGGSSITDLVLAQHGVDLWNVFIQLSLEEDITVDRHGAPSNWQALAAAEAGRHPPDHRTRRAHDHSVDPERRRHRPDGRPHRTGVSQLVANSGHDLRGAYVRRGIHQDVAAHQIFELEVA